MQEIIDSRKKLCEIAAIPKKQEEEGGCGVVGMVCSEKIPAKHVFVPCVQMHHRGNGKGGGILAVGLDAEQMQVPKEVLKTHYLIQVAYIDPKSREEVEKEFILPKFDVAKSYAISSKKMEEVKTLEVEPPPVYRYFCRPKKEAVEKFRKESKLEKYSEKDVEDEFVYQNTFRLNAKYYASIGEKRAFVLSHGKDMMVFKIVGYAEESVIYYNLFRFIG